MKQVLLKHTLVMLIVFVIINIIYIIFGFFSPDRLLHNFIIFIITSSILSIGIVCVIKISKTSKKQNIRETSKKTRFLLPLVLAIIIFLVIIFFIEDNGLSTKKIIKNLIFPLYFYGWGAFTLPLTNKHIIKVLKSKDIHKSC